MFCLLAWVYTFSQINSKDKQAFSGKSFQGQTRLDSLLGLQKESSLTAESEITLALQITELYKMRDLTLASAWAKKGIALALKNNSPHHLALAYELYADVISMSGNFVEGAAYFDKSVEVLDSLTDSLSQAQKYHTLMYSGGWLTPLVTNEQKIKYGLKSLAIYERIHNWEGVAKVNYSLGIIYNNKVMYEANDSNDVNLENEKFYYAKALYHNQKSEFFYREVGNKEGVAGALASQSENNMKLGRWSIAWRQIMQAKEMYESENCIIGLANCYWDIALLHHEKNHVEKALAYAKQSRLLYEESGYLAMIYELYDLEAILYVKMNNYKMALESSLQARKHRDSNYSYQRNKMIASIQNSYENKLRNEQVRLLSIQNDLKDTKLNKAGIIFWGTVGVLGAVLAGLAGFLYQRQRKLEQLQKNEILRSLIQINLEEKLQETKLSALRAQMNPHFVFNSINAIQNLILKENKTEAITYLNDFSKLTRETLENSSQETITLIKEVKFLEHYFQLEQLRHPDKFDFEIVIDTSIDDPGFERIPPMMIQPYIENSIKHGILNKEGKGLVKVSFQLLNDALICCIEDNGVGRKASAQWREENHHSLASEITDARLELLQNRSNIKQKHKIQIDDLYNERTEAIGTKVTLVIPVMSTVPLL